MPAATFDKQIFLEGGKQFEELLNKLRTGKQQLEHFRDYLHDRIQLEEEHATRVGKLLTKHRQDLHPIMTISSEEDAVKERSRPIQDLKKSILPSLDTMIREQKRVKDAQKAAIAATTKKLCDYGERLGKLSEKHLLKERELAAASGKICMTAKDEEKQRQSVSKLQDQLGKVEREQREVQDKMERCFEEWRVIAEQARELIGRHEAERERLLADLIQQYHSAVDGEIIGGKSLRGSVGLSRQSSNDRLAHQTSTDRLTHQTSTDRLTHQTTNDRHKMPTRSAYSSSLERLAALTTTTTDSPQPPAYNPTMRALYDYTAQSTEELSFKQGDCIELLDKAEDPWWRGRCNGRVGLFPSNFVQ